MHGMSIVHPCEKVDSLHETGFTPVLALRHTAGKYLGFLNELPVARGGKSAARRPHQAGVPYNKCLIQDQGYLLAPVFVVLAQQLLGLGIAKLGGSRKQVDFLGLP